MLVTPINLSLIVFVSYGRIAFNGINLNLAVADHKNTQQHLWINKFVGFYDKFSWKTRASCISQPSSYGTQLGLVQI